METRRGKDHFCERSVGYREIGWGCRRPVLLDEKCSFEWQSCAGEETRESREGLDSLANQALSSGSGDSFCTFSSETLRPWESQLQAGTLSC